MQDIKCYSVDWYPCTNMSVNHAVSYIVTFFNYNKAFSLLWLTELTLTGFQESCKVCHLWSALFNSLRAFTAKMKVFPLDSSLIHITMLIHHHYFYKNERKVYHNTLKHQHASFSGSSEVKLQKLWLLKGVFKLNFSKQRAYLKLSTSETYCIGYKCQLLWV